MRSTFVLLALLAAGGIATAEDASPAKPPAPAPPAPPRPPTREEVADAVLVAVKAKDDAALKALAARDFPDPWFVTDELIRRGEFDTADAFAKASPRRDVERLPDYITSRRRTPDDAAARSSLAGVDAALRANNPHAALKALGPPDAAPPADVVGILGAFGRGLALAAVGRDEESVAAFLVAADAAERLGWLARTSLALYGAGSGASRRSRFGEALSMWERRRRLDEARGDRANVAGGLVQIGRVHYALGNYPRALECDEEALRISEDLGDRTGVAVALGNLGNALRTVGRYPRALEVLERALKMKQDLGDRAGVAAELINIGVVHDSLGDPARALEYFERGLAAAESVGHREWAANALGNIGNVHVAFGDYPKALEYVERELKLKEALGNPLGVALALRDVGRVHGALGNYPRALEFQERALKALEALGSRGGVAEALSGIGNVYRRLGDYPKALEYMERARTEAEAAGDRPRVAIVLGNVGPVYAALGDYPKALEVLEKALQLKEELGNRASVVATLGSIGGVHASLGNHAKALEYHERAWKEAEAAGSRVAAANELNNIGDVHASLGDYPKALEYFERALASMEDAGDRAGAAATLVNIGTVHASLGNPAKALAYDRQAVLAANLLAGGLGAEEGVGAREPLAVVYDIGSRAAVALKDPAQLAFFLENGRAGALIEGLRAREALWAAQVPADLRVEETKARAAEALATKALREAIDAGDLPAVRARRAALDAASERVSSVIGRIQRTAKAGASLVYPVAATLDEIRATLVEGDALVLYGMIQNSEGAAGAKRAEPKACALVVTPADARIVTLATTAAIEAAVEALALDDAAVDPTEALAELARLVVEPLDLPPTTNRVLVSPTGALAVVPFAAILPDATVAYTASGTTYRMLRGDEGLRGEGVLALGDPDYVTKVDDRAVAVNRGTIGRLTPLPATREEATAVGTVTLLGGDATEAGLASALAKRPRWRAVHLACHGLVDPERPALSSLAITAAGDDDGFLTCLDVFRMKILADLVVLSACETGKGKVIKSEGVVGLTRAFMFAGAPRVISSLWKVDDEATRALMVRFYELWSPKDGKPGMPTADALRKAQEFVRAQPRWRHPYYWAAWVLWGLPG